MLSSNTKGKQKKWEFCTKKDFNFERYPLLLTSYWICILDSSAFEESILWSLSPCPSPWKKLVSFNRFCFKEYVPVSTCSNARSQPVPARPTRVKLHLQGLFHLTSSPTWVSKGQMAPVKCPTMGRKCCKINFTYFL